MGWPLTFSSSYPISPTTTTNAAAVSGTITLNMTNQIKLVAKVCRECQHVHFEGNPGLCGLVAGQMTSLVECACTEYVPTNNLEFLEWKHKKNESKKSLQDMSRSEVSS